MAKPTRLEDLKRLVSAHGDSDCCLIWPYARSTRYGRISINGKARRVHVVAFELFRSPDHEQILHTCDIGFCFNPRHLFSGDQLANVHDCIAKGRFIRESGVKHPKAKYIAKRAELFEAIRNERANGNTYSEIARLHNMSNYFAWTVVNRRHKTEQR